MARKDIDDLEVLRAYVDAKSMQLTPILEQRALVWPEQLLQQRTGQPEKVALAAMKRAFDRGLIEYGVSLRSGWLTARGARYLDDNKGWQKGGARFVRDAAGALVLVAAPVARDAAGRLLDGRTHDGFPEPR